MRHFFLMAIAVSGLSSASALACDGQAGKAIYEDTFADDSGGWDLSPPVTTIKPPNFVIALDSKSSAISAQVLTFHAKEADYCIEGTVPKAPAPDDNLSLGLEFWAADYKNFWLTELGSNGTVSLWTDVNGSWTNIATVTNAPAFKPDAANALRVTTLGGKIVISLNGQPVKTVRAQIPDGDQLRFGIYGQLDRPMDGVPPMLVTSYKVTSGQ